MLYDILLYKEDDSIIFFSHINILKRHHFGGNIHHLIARITFSLAHQILKLQVFLQDSSLPFKLISYKIK